MAKRFTDTEIWDNEWYMLLSPKHKCLLRFIFDKCDVAGVWSPNWPLASMYVGEPVSADDLAAFPDQVVFLSNGKIFIPDFIMFQYGKLSKDCKPHIPVYNSLSKNGIDIDTVKMADGPGKSHNVSDSTRMAIFRADDYTCCYCGKIKEDRNLVVDHVISRSRGGTDKPDNLVASCAPCNIKKSNLSLEEFCLKYSYDFITITNRVSERLSNRVLNALKEKEKEEDKEKEKEEDTETEEDEGGPGEVSEKLLVPQMTMIFKTAIPTYPDDRERDSKALMSIAKFLCQRGNLRGAPEHNAQPVLEAWEQIAANIREDRFYCQKSLYTISNHIQEIVQKALHGDKSKSTGTAKGGGLDDDKLKAALAKRTGVR